METLWHDLRYGFRMLARNPGLTVLALLALALGIGANTTIFSAVNAVLLRPPPVTQPEQLVEVYISHTDSRFSSFSYPDYADYRDQNQVFSGLIAFGGISVSLSTGNQPERVRGDIVTGNYFDVLGVHFALGRGFLPEEDQTPGAQPVVVISHDLWRRRFASDPQVAGKAVTINRAPYTVVGVTPEDFQSPLLGRGGDVWIPMMMQAQVRPPSPGLRARLGGFDLLDQRGPTWLRVMGRLKPGVTLEQARTEMNLIAARLVQAYPDTNQDRGINLTPLNQGSGLRAAALPALGLLMSAVGLVLLIACANVANLLLARAVARRKEIAIRLSLGASRGRLIQQLLTESVLLSLLAGAGGLLVALWGTELLYTFGIPRALRFTLDLRVFAFTLALSVLTGVFFGLVPAFQSSRPDLVAALKDEGGTGTGGRRSSRLQGLFVVAQVALSLVLLIGSGLFLRTLQKAYATDPGFNTGNVLLASLNLDLHGYSQREGQAFYGRLTERLQALPEVQSVSMARVVPLSGDYETSRVTFEGREIPPVDEWPRVLINVVGLDYFRTLGTPLLQGRTFDSLHSTTSPSVAVINRTMARRFWPDEDSLGKRFRFGSRGPFLEVIGVARDAKYRNLRQRAMPTVYLPLQQNYESSVTLFVRTAGDPTAALPAVRREVRALDADLPLFRIRTFARELQASLSEERLAATLLGSFSLLALALAAVGIYGVISYSVSQRTHEIGIRMALGAQPRDIFKLVVGQGMVLTLIGVGVGLAASFALTRFLESMLFGVSATDPATFAGVAVLLAGVALLACYLPARRATKVDPLVALRYE